MSESEEMQRNYRILVEAQKTKRKVGILALGFYNECNVSRIWWDDYEDKVDFNTTLNKSWIVGVGSISAINVL